MGPGLAVLKPLIADPESSPDKTLILSPVMLLVKRGPLHTSIDINVRIDVNCVHRCVSRRRQVVSTCRALRALRHPYNSTAAALRLC